MQEQVRQGLGVIAVLCLLAWFAWAQPGAFLLVGVAAVIVTALVAIAWTLLWSFRPGTTRSPKQAWRAFLDAFSGLG